MPEVGVEKLEAEKTEKGYRVRWWVSGIEHEHMFEEEDMFDGVRAHAATFVGNLLTTIALPCKAKQVK